MNTHTSTLFGKALGIFALAMFAGIVAARATVINVTVDASGALRNGVGVATSDEYGYGNNNPESNLGFLNNELTNYNANFDPDLPAGVPPVGADYGSLGDISSYTSIGGYDYVVFHFGAGQATYTGTVWVPQVVIPAKGNKPEEIIPGHFKVVDSAKSQGGWWAAFYIGGMAGITFNVPVPGPTYEELVYNGQPVGGFSSARYFNPTTTQVPDNGTTALLIVIGLVSLAIAGRRAKNA